VRAAAICEAEAGPPRSHEMRPRSPEIVRDVPPRSPQPSSVASRCAPASQSPIKHPSVVSAESKSSPRFRPTFWRLMRNRGVPSGGRRTSDANGCTCRLVPKIRSRRQWAKSVHTHSPKRAGSSSPKKVMAGLTRPPSLWHSARRDRQGHHGQSRAIKGNQGQSRAITGNQGQSRGIIPGTTRVGSRRPRKWRA